MWWRLMREFFHTFFLSFISLVLSFVHSKLKLNWIDCQNTWLNKPDWWRRQFLGRSFFFGMTHTHNPAYTEKKDVTTKIFLRFLLSFFLINSTELETEYTVCQTLRLWKYNVKFFWCIFSNLVAPTKKVLFLPSWNYKCFLLLLNFRWYFVAAIFCCHVTIKEDRLFEICTFFFVYSLAIDLNQIKRTRTINLLKCQTIKSRKCQVFNQLREEEKKQE